ncbi:hypothetical protein MTO96_004600 [Rhipicephalus appendiculatus]
MFFVAVNYSDCFTHGVKVVHPHRLQKALTREDLDIHLLCPKGSDFQRMLYFESSVKMLSWCLNWKDYHKVLTLACLHQKQVVVAASNTVWNDMTLGISQLRKDCSPYITRVSVDEQKPASPSLQAFTGRKTAFMPSIYNTRSEKAVESINGVISGQKFDAHCTCWTRLSGKRISLGCILEQNKNAFGGCASLERNTFAQALPLLNATFRITPVREGMFSSALRKREVDIMIHSIGLTPDRYQKFHFTVNRFGQAVYYVQKRWTHQAAFFLGVFPWLFLLALYMVVSASCFVLLNIHRGHRPMNGVGEVALALMATTLSLSATIRLEHARSRSGRVIMACWMLACFSLTTYSKSLLTASLMARPVWEADDRLDEMLPKLRRGMLLPCAENNSFMDVLLARADGSTGDAMDIMALAVRRWGHKKARISGSNEDCLERTRRGTHVFLTDSFTTCKQVRFEKIVAAGEKPVLSLVGGFPIRKDHPLRSICTGKSNDFVERDLGGRVVKTLVDDLAGKYHRVFFDNYFSSYHLLKDLAEAGIYACGTVNASRKHLPNLKSDKMMKRGETYCSVSNDELCCLKCRDKRTVHLLSNFHDPVEEVQVNRKEKDGAITKVNCPAAPQEYSKNINFVDKFHQMKGQY